MIIEFFWERAGGHSAAGKDRMAERLLEAD